MEKNDIINWVPEGWRELTRYWLEEYIEEWWKLENITYVKEKYWRLVFEYYWEWRILEDISIASWYTCIVCGKAWRIRYSLPWYTCYCDDHYSLAKNKLTQKKD